MSEPDLLVHSRLRTSLKSTISGSGGWAGGGLRCGEGGAGGLGVLGEGELEGLAGGGEGDGLGGGETGTDGLGGSGEGAAV